MGKFVTVNIGRSYGGGAVKKAPDRFFNLNEMIDIDKQLNQEMNITKNTSLYHGFSRITGLTLKGYGE